jgi:hypothetical protein
VDYYRQQIDLVTVDGANEISVEDESETPFFNMDDE